MHIRSAIAVLAGTGALAASLGLAPTAQADPPTPVTCTITGTSPSTFALGVTTRTIQFGVQTSCDGTYPAHWDLTSDRSVNSPTPSWLLLRNYDIGYGEKYPPVVSADGDDPLNFVTNGTNSTGNRMAGPHPLYASAFYDANGNGRVDADEPLSKLTTTVIAKRETAFAGLYASARHRQAGRRVTLSATLQRANWDTGTVDGFAAPVELQFRADGHHHWHDVKSVTSDGTSATTVVRATTSGSYRYHYLGDDVSGAAYSASAHVSVHTPHHHHHNH